ncbi:MAG: hypothetical protein CR217_10400 [Beijerinckiaceae bacterium]|nr:MAG: hypothetical protein CR217_10400 [Beijerinckiaceae bacterium]
MVFCTGDEFCPSGSPTWGPAHAFRGQGYRVREPSYERPPMQFKQNAGNGRARVNAIDIAAIDIKASPCNEAPA